MSNGNVFLCTNSLKVVLSLIGKTIFIILCLAFSVKKANLFCVNSISFSLHISVFFNDNGFISNAFSLFISNNTLLYMILLLLFINEISCSLLFI